MNPLKESLERVQPESGQVTGVVEEVVLFLLPSGHHMVDHFAIGVESTVRDLPVIYRDEQVMLLERKVKTR